MNEHAPPSVLPRAVRPLASLPGFHNDRGPGLFFGSSDVWLTVLQFNTLADALATPDAFPLVPPSVLNWAHRRSRLLYEITQHSPDIVCLQVRPAGARTRLTDRLTLTCVLLPAQARALVGAVDRLRMQEVDHYHDCFAPALEGCGYDGVFVQKGDAGVSRGDGCALFFARERYDPPARLGRLVVGWRDTPHCILTWTASR